MSKKKQNKTEPTTLEVFDGEKVTTITANWVPAASIEVTTPLTIPHLSTFCVLPPAWKGTGLEFIWMWLESCRNRDDKKYIEFMRMMEKPILGLSQALRSSLVQKVESQDGFENKAQALEDFFSTVKAWL